ncbi:DinB family protein [Prosthecodimorpha staleyi]|uniref:DinB family protein n=1 Tax=Prosthecodimorpha staleyi TaxID=2840188 RepID=A0A947D4M9_9HYPH|nr:DinB family protein [Prosthecodimorpha staleyi]MBT9289496.1 DinB family protein [Prosthecodimorpha staleyi]
MLNHFRMFAGYNAWANRRLYEAAAALPEADYRADHGAFFGSLHRTLNHILVGDRIWMRRFTGAGEAPNRLDTILHDDLAGLTEARFAEDRRIVDWVGGIDAARLAAPFNYVPVTRPEPVTQPLAPALAHLFNHQTHHRGQAHVILTRTVGRAPDLDLIVFQRETGMGM